MADPQDQPDHAGDAAPESAPGAGPTPPAPPDPAPGAAEPEKAVKKAAAKKAPAKAAKKAAKKAQKAPAKKAPAKKSPAKKAQPAVAKKVDPPLRAETNGQHAAGAKEAAAQAKSTVDAAKNPLAGAIDAPADRFPVPLAAVVVAVSLLALLLLRQLRRRGD